MCRKTNIAVLISGSGTNLQAIIDACESGKIDGKVVVVGADNNNAKGLDRAKNRGIPTFVIDYSQIIKSFKDNQLPIDFNLKDVLSKQSIFDTESDPEKVKLFMMTRSVAEEKLFNTLSSFDFDLLALAGFMRILTPYFIDKVNKDRMRIINIHPALLPSFPGTDGYGDTFRYGCKVGGCTVHFVDYGEDSGPIIGQKAFEINDCDTLETVKEKGLKLEWELYPHCIQLFEKLYHHR
ncbi:MAG: phosphoribosylglycinamide formyltransferase [Desulfobacterales bacterium]|nr:phosphoribosylglycinamide formyltransferase [Desulfobacterales bacterium]